MKKTVRATKNFIIIEEEYVNTRFLQEEDLERLNFEYLGVSKDGQALFRNKDNGNLRLYYTTEDIVKYHKEFILNYI